MKLVYTEEELRSIDSAIPIAYWDKIDTSIHVMNYNEPHRYGKLQNIETEACQRGVEIERYTSDYLRNIVKEAFVKGRRLTRDSWEKEDWEDFESLEILYNNKIAQ